MAKLTSEEFIKKARKAHGDRYDYSMVDNEHGAIQDVTFKYLCFKAKTHKYPK